MTFHGSRQQASNGIDDPAIHDTMADFYSGVRSQYHQKTEHRDSVHEDVSASDTWKGPCQ